MGLIELGLLWLIFGLGFLFGAFWAGRPPAEEKSDHKRDRSYLLSRPGEPPSSHRVH
jgi:hypothetical protein